MKSYTKLNMDVFNSRTREWEKKEVLVPVRTFSRKEIKEAKWKK